MVARSTAALRWLIMRMMIMIIITTMTNNDHACDNADADHDGWGETCRLGAGRGRRHQLQGENSLLVGETCCSSL